ncbi:MAG: IS66-like element accessory protein TnpA [Gemmataceae bacterium]
MIVKEELRSAHRSTREVRGEVLSESERRRRWSTEEKLRILAQSVTPGSSVSLVCRMHGISSGQLYTWRKQFRTGELTGFAPVTVVAETREMVLPAPAPAPDTVSPIPAAPIRTSAIEVELPSGVKLRLTSDVEEALLRRVLSALS